MNQLIAFFKATAPIAVGVGLGMLLYEGYKKATSEKLEAE